MFHDNPQVEVIFDTNPEKYQIKLSQEEMAALIDVLPQVKATIVSKKALSLGKVKLRYSMIKVNDNEFYLIGNGARHKGIIDPSSPFAKTMQKNAVIGEGAYGKVKATACINLTATGWQFSENVYVLKKFVSRWGDPARYADVLQEVSCFNKVYGGATLIEAPKRKANGLKYYILMPKLPGVALDKVASSTLNVELIAKMVGATYRSISHIHSKDLMHGDLYLKNILYDLQSERAYITDFGCSYRFDNNDKDKKLFEYFIYQLIGKFLREKCNYSVCDFYNIKPMNILEFTLSKQISDLVNKVTDGNNRFIYDPRNQKQLEDSLQTIIVDLSLPPIQPVKVQAF